MPKIMSLGGIWKNTEDEILKAAVMKYGKNQWARISSLLVRKSPKQCKARWYEWLDPSIKKTEWTREEEEKLLHLAKIMPTQWRTIAPIIGRTAAQCLRHYERLLNAAQSEDKDGDDSSDPRILQPGQIDPDPESKPARPDPIDMDEDEKEMLSEARARLANTKGKKAKRKAREKQLEQARRMAFLQKRRELKAAGFNYRGGSRGKLKRGQMDYLNEIPLEHQPLKGFFDTTGDLQRTFELQQQKKQFLGKKLTQLDGIRRDEVEERERKKDARREKLHRKTNLPGAIEHANKMNDPKYISMRSTLVLPAPQITDEELEDINKMGGIEAVTAAASENSSALAPTPMRTPRTPMGVDSIMQEAAQLISLTKAQTPLKGGESTPLLHSDFSGITPKKREVQTPNLLASAVGNRTPSAGTPSRGTPMRSTPSGSMTPVRDDMRINQEVPATANYKRQQRKLRQQLKSGLMDLPKPSHEYQLVMPDIPEDDTEDVVMEEDAEEVIGKQQAAIQAAKARELRMRSEVLRKGFPRPFVVNSGMELDLSAEESADVSKLIHDEMMLLLRHDAAKYPLTKKAPANIQMTKFTEAEINAARAVLAEELEVVNQARGHMKNIKEVLAAHDATLDDYVYLPAKKQFGSFSKATKAQRLEALEQTYNLLVGQLSKSSKKAKKLENKLNILLGGYQRRTQQMITATKQLEQTLIDREVDLSCFSMLLEQESKATPIRLQRSNAEVQKLKEMEKALQKEYKDLVDEGSRLKTLLSSR